MFTYLKRNNKQAIQAILTSHLYRMQPTTKSNGNKRKTHRKSACHYGYVHREFDFLPSFLTLSCLFMYVFVCVYSKEHQTEHMNDTIDDSDFLFLFLVVVIVVVVVVVVVFDCIIRSV
jgi:hypothetical protein